MFKIDIALVVFASLTAAVSSVLGKAYNIKVNEYKTRTEDYCLVMMFTAFCFWAVAYFIDPSKNVRVLPYSFIFGIGYVMACLGYLYAIKYGSVALSALFSKFSLIGATVWGLIFWDTEITVFTIIGLILVAVSVFLCVYKKEKSNINFKWLIFALCAFLGNVACTVAQKQQQMDFGGEHGNCFMFRAMFVSCMITIAIRKIVIIKKGNVYKIPKLIDCKSIMPAISGASNYLMNLFVMMLATSALNPAFIYPTISVVGISVTTLASIFLFKEKPTRIQWVGIILGTAACVILSL